MKSNEIQRIPASEDLLGNPKSQEIIGNHMSIVKSKQNHKKQTWK